jgi:hypothetical protein
MTQYEPTPNDIAWTQNLIASLNDGGHWAWPAAERVFRVNKQAKTFTLIAGKPPTNLGAAKSDENWEMLKAVLSQIGYTLRSSL